MKEGEPKKKKKKKDMLDSLWWDSERELCVSRGCVALMICVRA